MIRKIIIALVALFLVVVGLYLAVPPSGRLYQDQNSYSLVWRDQWLGLTLNQDIVLKTDYWNEDHVNLSPGFSPIFQGIKLAPGESFFVKKGSRCARIRVDQVVDRIAFTAFADGSSRSFEATNGALAFDDFNVGVSANKADEGELYIFASGLSSGEVTWFSFPAQSEIDMGSVTCNNAVFVRYPWETGNKWIEMGEQKAGQPKADIP